MLNASTTEEVPKELLENELICEAVEYMKVAAYTKAQLETYSIQSHARLFEYLPFELSQILRQLESRIMLFPVFDPQSPSRIPNL